MLSVLEACNSLFFFRFYAFFFPYIVHVLIEIPSKSEGPMVTILGNKKMK